MTKIAVFGACGRVGSCALAMLKEAGRDAVGLDVGDYSDDVYDDYDVFLAAVPWQVCEEIAYQVTKRRGKLYLDLTEDVDVGVQIRRYANGGGSIFVPHCGLAPGAVSILANAMLPARSVTMRVGALPVNPSGRLRYALNWNTEGLVNEYLRVPFGVRGHVIEALEPMGDLTTEGDLESFNTSGGIGTFGETRSGEVAEITYQTIRYAGHHELMMFLLEDCGFRDKPEALVKLLDAHLPHNTEDEVLIAIDADERACGWQIRGDGRWSAIQRATAAGAVAVLQYLVDNPGVASVLSRDGWIANEDISLSGVQSYKCWTDVYGAALEVM